MTDNESHALIDLEIMFDYFQKSNDIIGFHKQFDSQKKKSACFNGVPCSV